MLDILFSLMVVSYYRSIVSRHVHSKWSKQVIPFSPVMWLSSSANIDSGNWSTQNRASDIYRESLSILILFISKLPGQLVMKWLHTGNNPDDSLGFGCLDCFLTAIFSILNPSATNSLDVNAVVKRLTCELFESRVTAFSYSIV